MRSPRPSSCLHGRGWWAAADLDYLPELWRHTFVRLRSFITLTPTHYGVLLLAAPLVVAIRVALWLLPSRTVLRIVRRFESSHAAESVSHAAPLGAIVWAIDAASRRVPRATCLTQALAGKVLLRCFGFDAQLCLGVARGDDGSLRAHAWLERDGRAVVGGDGARHLARLPSLGDDLRLPMASFTP